MDFKPGEMSNLDEVLSSLPPASGTHAPKIVVVKKKQLGDGLGGGSGLGKGQGKSHKLLSGGVAGGGMAGERGVGEGGEYYKFEDINRLTGSGSDNRHHNRHLNQQQRGFNNTDGGSGSSPVKKINPSSNTSTMQYQQAYQQRFGVSTGGEGGGGGGGFGGGGGGGEGEGEEGEEDVNEGGKQLRSTMGGSLPLSSPSRSKPPKGVSFAPHAQTQGPGPGPGLAQGQGLAPGQGLAQGQGLALASHAQKQGLDPYKIPPVTGGLGAMYNRSAPSAGGGGASGSSGSNSNASGGNSVGNGGGGGSGYLVRLPAQQAQGLASHRNDDDDDGEDDDDDDGEDDGIGWSPFVVPSGK